MTNKYHLGLAAFIGIACSAAFLGGWLGAMWTLQTAKEEAQAMVEEIQDGLKSLTLTDDLRNVRMRLELLQAIESGDEDKLEGLAERYGWVLERDKMMIQQRVEDVPDEKWVREGRQLLVEINEHLDSQ
jgi:hypothetical protein